MLTPSAADALRRRQPELDGRLFAPGVPKSLFGPGLGARLASRLRADSLDRALADGADPTHAVRLAARAAHLTCPKTRARLAVTVERFVQAADLAPRRSQVRPSRGGVDANRRELLELATALRDSAPVYARGVAELKLMLRDGTGPAYTDRRGEALARQLELVRAGLRG
jgi:hypothetical protein